MEMTIHRALLELKTLKKRIEKEISGAEFITCVKGRADKINGVPRKEVEAKYQSNYDTIVGLISNYEKIKTAVIRSNAGLQGEARTVIVNGSAYTVAELIEELNTVYGREYNHGFKGMLAARMQNELSGAKRWIDIQDKDSESKIIAYLSNVAGKDTKLTSEEVARHTEDWHKYNDLSLVDPLNLEARIKALNEEIEKFRVEADAKLSEENAIRKINVDLTSL